MNDGDSITQPAMLVGSVCQNHAFRTGLFKMNAEPPKSGADETDETDREQLRDEIDSLKRSNDDLYRFAYMAAHELQEPLRAIDSFTKLLKDRYGADLSVEANEWLGEAIAGSSRMRNLIKSLLTLSLVDSQNIQFDFVNCNDVLNAALVDLKPTIDAKNVSIELESDLPRLQANETLLTLLFRNLIGNSIKYCTEKPTIKIRSSHSNGEWNFEFEDNGIGFDMKYASKIFLPFERLHSKLEYPGTGLGLALCRRIIDRHNGKIWAQSTINVGSTFSFILPESKSEKS
jgi:light-regulated signal transduction histidine kinase (bacteriophytochrome)